MVPADAQKEYPVGASTFRQETQLGRLEHLEGFGEVACGEDLNYGEEHVRRSLQFHVSASCPFYSHHLAVFIILLG